MATKCNSTLGTLTSGAPGSYLMTDSSGTLSWSSKNDTMVEFVEFALEIMGIDLKYSEFTKMSDAEKIAFIRDLKIKKILD
jgi:hypothetical protein